MLIQGPERSRSLRVENLQSDLVVVGGGLAGVCCAITAARAGTRVTLAQDRPVLGGNASSEVRLWTLGATSHMINNNRWAREGGLIDEILVENLFRNPEGNPLLFDALLLEKTIAEPNITLLLNTAVHEAETSEDGAITKVAAFCSQNATRYVLSAPLFVDASGDGVVGFLAGAAFRMGAEATSEFGEKFAPSREYGELLGHSLYFYSKDAGKPVRYVPPAFALADVETAIPRFRSLNAQSYGCRLWWFEWGGRLDTVHDTEKIKWELWKVVYGVWDYIKNSGKFPEAENLTLEWVGHIPGKRESRRFEGDYMLRQQDIVEQREFDDVVAFGGWSIDLHPADGIFSEHPGCNQWHSKGIFGIPYRSYYSRNVPNLFLAGRIISASHVAFGSTRVMATCAHGAQAVGAAAAICAREGLQPRDMTTPARMTELQRDLLRAGQHLPGRRLRDDADLVQRASIAATSRLRLESFPPDGPLLPLKESWAMLLPAEAGPAPSATFWVDVDEPGAVLDAELRVSSRSGSHTPDTTLDRRRVTLSPGRGQSVTFEFDARISEPGYLFVCLMHNDRVQVRCTEHRVTGVMSVCRWYNPASGEEAAQTPPRDIGVDAFEFWTPRRRPNGQNLAVTLGRRVDVFGPDNLINGVQRPTTQPNAWVADTVDPSPELTFTWDAPQTIGRIELFFDTDYDHAMESVLMGHPESVTPFCVRAYTLRDSQGRVLAERLDNHQTRNTILLEPPVHTDRLTLEVEHPSASVPASVFEIRAYER
ncbi:hypothetical protein CCAX7_40690 [Capsulimonas corticalis]|uniref:Uncharacterized protein n=2 Tax=Capsulimonas corticalis TaxID=2219043 RepID=A0A402D6D9_9BACT|nr:hypothetical protein CCAX7_40690 [Capsulimonas corticalis]